MRTNPRPRRLDAGPTWLAWWVKWALILFWPLIFGMVAAEAVWIVLIGIVALLAWTGHRKKIPG